MLEFVDAMLGRLHGANSNSAIASLLGQLADQLGYRSAYLLDFPNDPSRPIELWDSDQKRALWWREQTDNGMNSISRSLAETLAQGEVRHLRVAPDDPRYKLALQYDFVESTVVPISFDTSIRGVVSLQGNHTAGEDLATSLQIVCYALLVQARSIGHKSEPQKVLLTPREREVIELSAIGLTSDMVAIQLGMSARTVNQHIENVAFKLKTRNRVHTVAEALRLGLLR